MSEDSHQSHPEELPTEQQYVEATDVERNQAQQESIDSQIPMPEDLDSRPETHVNDGSLEVSEEPYQARESSERTLDDSNGELQPTNDSGEALFSKDNLRQAAQEYIERNANSPLYDVASNYSNITVHKEILGLAADDIDKLHASSQSFMDSIYSEEGSVYQALDAIDALYSTHAYNPSNDYDGMADGYYSNSLSLDDILSGHNSSLKAFMKDAGEEAEVLVKGVLDALNECKEELVQSLYDATAKDKDSKNRHAVYSRKSNLRAFVNSVFAEHLSCRNGEVRRHEISQLRPYPDGESYIQNLRDRHHAEDSDLAGSFTANVIKLAQSDIEKFVTKHVQDSMRIDYDSGEVRFGQSGFHFGRGVVGRGK